MDKYTPTELHDIQNMKKRVMNNVNAHVSNLHVKQKSFNWRFATLTAIFTLCIIGYTGYEIVYKGNLLNNDPVVIKEPEDNNTGIIHEAPYDFTRPEITVVNDKFYIEGVTLGDSLEKVTSMFGQNFVSEPSEEGSSANLIIDYDNVARFYFHDEILTSTLLFVVDEPYIIEFYEEYNGIKEKTDYQHFLYNTAGTQAIKAEKIEDALYVYFLPKTQDSTVPSPGEIDEAPLDYSRPNITIVEDQLYIEGVTLGDSFEKVKSIFGQNFTSKTSEEGSSANLVIDYNNAVKFYFHDGSLKRMLLLVVDEQYIKGIYEEYTGLKEQTEFEQFLYDEGEGTPKFQFFIYNNAGTQIIKAEKIEDALYVYFLLPNGHF